jgi:NHS family xanthosine MFS transporter
MAFDFFNISGSLFIEQSANKEIRSSAQGLFTTMVNGVGAVFGSLSSGYIIQHFFINQDGSKQWNNIWMTFAIYALIVAIAFVFLFKDSKQKAWNN